MTVMETAASVGSPRVTYAGVLRPARDLALERWRHRADDSSVSRSRSELLSAVLHRLSSLPAHSLDRRLDGSVYRLLEALSELLADGDPTPQASLDHDGDPQVEWLVAGERLTLVIDEGGGALWALDERGCELFAYEWTLGERPYEAYRTAAQHLRRMSAMVCFRVEA